MEKARAATWSAQEEEEVTAIGLMNHSDGRWQRRHMSNGTRLP
jgi:hypothetical protein